MDTLPELFTNGILKVFLLWNIYIKKKKKNTDNFLIMITSAPHPIIWSSSRPVCLIVRSRTHLVQFVQITPDVLLLFFVLGEVVPGAG